MDPLGVWNLNYSFTFWNPHKTLTRRNSLAGRGVCSAGGGTFSSVFIQVEWKAIKTSTGFHYPARMLRVIQCIGTEWITSKLALCYCSTILLESKRVYSGLQFGQSLHRRDRHPSFWSPVRPHSTAGLRSEPYHSSHQQDVGGKAQSMKGKGLGSYSLPGHTPGA